MYVCKSGGIAYFDVDDTLLEWKTCDPHDLDAIKIVNNGHTFYKRAIRPNIDGLIDHSHAGHIVVVWSHGRVEWAETVVKALGLEKYVNAILTKPDWYYDDKEAEYWLPKRQFKE